MNKEDIIRMARKAGFADSNGVIHAAYQLESFAALVASAEREACARMCELMWHKWLDSPEACELNVPDAEDCYRAIRARGQA